MRDKVYLQVNGRKIESFLSYRIEADIYTADDAFSFDIPKPGMTIKPGMDCELWVNDKPELTGIIDRIVTKDSKSGVEVRIEGRDLMGLVVDSYCIEFFDLRKMTLKELAERLLKNIPYINRKDIIYQENVAGHLKRTQVANAVLAMPQEFAHITPGATVFEVLKTYAMSRGVMFFSLPDGTFVFGRPEAKAKPQFTFINKRSDPKGNNVIEGVLDRNISKRYSEIRFYGQPQGTDINGMPVINAPPLRLDDRNFAWPFYKPFTAEDNNDAQGLMLHAQLLMDRMRFESFQLHYRVSRHSQNNKNYEINKIARVVDETRGLDGDYLIYGRTFEMSRQGVFTMLKLSYPGMVIG